MFLGLVVESGCGSRRDLEVSMDALGFRQRWLCSCGPRRLGLSSPVCSAEVSRGTVPISTTLGVAVPDLVDVDGGSKKDCMGI